MQTTIEELLQIIGTKDVELFMLRKQLATVAAELATYKAKETPAKD